MKTDLHPQFAATAQGREAEAIVRACVHCGFCTATCPTYQELGDERDGPRGRIYLIKQLFEGGAVTERTRVHLDRCLTCRACETTCPSGVRYGRLIDIGRGVLEQTLPRAPWPRLMRWGLRAILPQRGLFGSLLALGRTLRPLLPPSLKAHIPPRQDPGQWPAPRHRRVMLVLQGCAQPALTPNTNAAAARVLDRLGIGLRAIPEAGCCGALSYHLGAHGEGLDAMRRTIDAWWPAIEQGAEAIVISASGCGALVKEYGHLLRHDPAYAAKAQRVSQLARDLSEILLEADLSGLAVAPHASRVAVHAPCSLQHGQGLPDSVARILARVGFHLVATQEDHLCCGSAGTYSILQPALSQRLLARKVAALEGDTPEIIVTANVGCQLHLQTGTHTKVCHWIELLDQIGEWGFGNKDQTPLGRDRKT